MDIRCSICGEPWDPDCIHDEIQDRWPNEPWKINGKHDQKVYETYYDKIRQDFRSRGCAALESYGARCSSATKADPVVGELMDLLGEDVDGAMALMEDAEAVGIQLQREA